MGGKNVTITDSSGRPQFRLVGDDTNWCLYGTKKKQGHVRIILLLYRVREERNPTSLARRQIRLITPKLALFFRPLSRGGN